MPIRVNPDETFHVLFGQNVREMDLDALDLAYRADAIEDETLIWQEGLGEWLRLDVVLERLSSQEAAEAHEAHPHYSLPAPAPAPDVYFVLLGADDTKQMSLDQLDDAYRLDVIDEGTLVWQPGFAEWIRLDQLLALADEEAPAPSVSFYAQPAASQPAYSQPAARSVAPQSFGYVIGRPADSTAPVTNSLAPALDLDDLDDLRPRPASAWYRRSLVAAAAAVALLGAHRTGLTQGLLTSLGADRALGEPSVETPHGVSSWLSRLESENRLDQLSPTDPVPAAAPAPVASPVAPAAALAPAQEAAERPNEPTKQPESEAAVAPALSPATPPAAADSLPLGPASGFANTLQGKKPVGATARPAARPAAKRASSKTPKGSGLAYDPMNGTL